MHTSLDQALGRQPRLNRVGQSLLNIGSGASAAYSLRSLTGDEPKAVRIRRDGDNEERDFTTAEIGTEAADWTNGKQETTLPADVATSAAAYSLRKVKSDYTGHAVRIRRTSDDIDADVAFDTNDTVSNDSIVTEVISGNQSTLQAFISGTNAAVAIWYDQSGNSKNATQTTDANQPLIAAGGTLIKRNGKPAVKSTSDNVMNFTLDSLSSDGQQSVFAVLENEVSSQDGYGDVFNIYSTSSESSGRNRRPLWFSPPSGNRIYFSVDDLAGYHDDSTDYHLFTHTMNNTSGGTSTIFKDGAQVDTRSITLDANPNFSQGRIAGVTSNATGALYMAEIIIYNSDQTSNRFKIESNINNYYTIYTAAQNGFVNTWYDQSGNGFNAVADADENEPKIVNSGSLLTDGVKFSESKSLELSGTGLDIFKNTQHAQIFYAIKINDTSTSTTGFFEARTNTSGSRVILRNSNDTAGRISLAGRRLDSDSFSSFQSDSGHNNEKVVLTGFINYSDTDAFIFKNGTQIGSDTSFSTAGATSDTSSSNITIGRKTALEATAEFDAEELIIFNTDQTANRTAIETNIANQYGITLS